MIEVAVITLRTGARVTVLAEGNRVVLRGARRLPMELTPMEAVELGEALVEAGSRRWN